MTYTHNTLAVLPSKLVEDIELAFDNKTLKNHALRFVHGLMKKSMRDFGVSNALIDVPYNYLVKVYSKKYNLWLKTLLAKNIISSSNYSNTYIHQSYSYNINNYYFLTSPIMSPLFGLCTSKTISYSVKYQNCEKEFFDLKEFFIADIKSLKIDYQGLINIMEKEIEGLKIENFKTNENIIFEGNMPIFFYKGVKQESYYLDREKALRISKSKNKTFIQDDKQYYIMSVDNFLEIKKQSILLSYREAITKLSKGIYFCRRNSTNNRLDTNLTNMANVLTKKIFTDNDLVCLDLANAQFAILADIFQRDLDTEDFKSFRSEAVLGTLYEHVQENLNLESRKKAKVLVFELLFSKETNISEQKKELRELFPSVVDKVDDFKKENGYKKFSVMLQKREAEIFIDGILKLLKKKKLFCLTKHDCIIIRRNDKQTVIDIMNKYFSKIKFEGKIVEE